MTLDDDAREGPPSPAEVRARAQDWTDAQLACRASQHRWQPLRAVLNRRYGFWRCDWQCDRCATEKSSEIDADTGEVWGTWYAYDDGYLATGMGRMAGDARGIIRLASLQRSFPRTTLRARDAAKAEPRTRAAKLRRLKD